MTLMIATLVTSSAVAYVVCRLQDIIVEPWRSRIRSAAAKKSRVEDVKAILVGT